MQILLLQGKNNVLVDISKVHDQQIVCTFCCSDSTSNSTTTRVIISLAYAGNFEKMHLKIYAVMSICSQNCWAGNFGKMMVGANQNFGYFLVNENFSCGDANKNFSVIF